MKEIRVFFLLDFHRRLYGHVEASELGLPGRGQVKVVLDRRATVTPKANTAWFVRPVGRTRDGRVVFVLPVEPAKDREEREWAERLRQREEAAREAAVAQARELNELDPAFVAEVERVLGLLASGPTRPEPNRPKAPTTPRESVYLGMFGHCVFFYLPAEDGRVVVEQCGRSTPVARGARSRDASFTYNYQTLGDALSHWRVGEETAEEFRSVAQEADREWAAYLTQMAAYNAAKAEYEAERQGWLAEGHNRLVDLHRRGWLEVRNYGDRQWLYAVTQEGDSLPVLSWDELRQAIN